MQHIIEGFLSFQKEIFPQRKELFRSLASSQNPKALFISCSDSRLVPELVTQQEPGQLFVIRNAGNIVPPFGPEPGGVSATIEYAVVALGVTDIVICGHSNCGAMKAIADNANLEPMPAVSHWLRYADAAKAVVEKKTWARLSHSRPVKAFKLVSKPIVVVPAFVLGMGMAYWQYRQNRKQARYRLRGDTVLPPREPPQWR